MSSKLQCCYEQLVAGDQRALDFLMKKYGNALRYFAFSKVRDKDVAEDIVAESYCKLWYNRIKLTSASHLNSFLYRVTNNACIDYLKSHKVKFMVADSLGHYEYIESDECLYSKILYNEFLESLLKFSEQLPKMQSDVFKLSVIEGLETKEICEILGTTESTVYYSKSKALSSIRDVLLKNNLAIYIAMLNIFLVESN